MMMVVMMMVVMMAMMVMIIQRTVELETHTVNKQIKQAMNNRSTTIRPLYSNYSRAINIRCRIVMNTTYS
jgi:predicted Holliday junction resolvase-like endonuclease